MAAWAATCGETASPACPGPLTSPAPPSRSASTSLRCASTTSACAPTAAGRHRGGLGQEILIESRSQTPIAVSFLAERTIFPAFGIEGGKAGAPGELRINGEKVDPKRQYVLRKGETVLLATPGGGGHGGSALRLPASIASDLEEGLVTAPGGQE
jgi:N-methylhydantoinase B/oxoprolinase/acetone carboxylase alpha subunit